VKKLLLTVSLMAFLSFGLPSALMADPGGPNLQLPVLLTCSDGRQVNVTPGTLTNRGRVAWDLNSTSVLVTAYLAFDDGTGPVVIFDSKRGLTNLITCTGDTGVGFTVIVKGFFTPR
jgi:hypothetical protein